jgi:hypothetical protein
MEDIVAIDDKACSVPGSRDCRKCALYQRNIMDGQNIQMQKTLWRRKQI